jgi:S1-C subfamily serine protease
MITSNVISRVFHLKFGDSLGTCFTIDIGENQYIITAKHVVNTLKTGDKIELFYKGVWTKFNVRLIGHCNDADVSVFVIDILILGHPLPATSAGMNYGQDVYFLGFPYGLKAEVGNLNRDFPLPLVKKGILSAFLFDQPGKPFLIDGYNNPGFSGGPVVFKQNFSPDFNVAGIISGYRFVYEDTFLNNVPTAFQIKTNTGIIIAFSIKNAVDLIEANPNGNPLKEIGG